MNDDGRRREGRDRRGHLARAGEALRRIGREGAREEDVELGRARR